nr:MAG: portal protein [Bacteriophage sp.]
MGTVLNLEDGSTFQYASATMDRESIKLELDYIIQQFYAIACVPSSILGQSNVANVSETSITMLYQQTDNFCKQYIASMQEGFLKRLEYMRRLMEIKGMIIDDDVFDSISISFNVNRPVDNKSDMENMKMQYECGAMSRQTIIDKSPYTTDTALELQRIEDEAKKDAAKQETKTVVVDANNQNAETDENVSEEQNIEVDDKVD